jgi:hypothetical protein
MGGAGGCVPSLLLRLLSKNGLPYDPVCVLAGGVSEAAACLN